jgi:hypothetical protein
MVDTSLRRDVLLPAAAAAGFAALLITVGPAGVDLAAHEYQRGLFIKAGFVVWNNFWYAGSYSFVGYSLLYYPLAALAGTTAVAIASVGAAAFGFALVVRREWGRTARVSCWAFAILWAGIVLPAAFPFALGTALALFALAALQSNRTWIFALLAFLALSASPLAFMLLAVVVVGVGVGRPRELRRIVGPALVIAAAAAVQLVAMRIFPRGGHFPFTFLQLVPALLFSAAGVALTRNVPRARALLGFYMVYAVACAAAFAIPTELGSNIERLRFAAVPILLLTLALRGWRPLRYAVPVVVLAAIWNLAPDAPSALRVTIDGNKAYWQPAVQFLHANLSPSYRVEAVDTVDHWAGDFLPTAGIPIVRGWYRQNDFPQNGILYDNDEPFAASSYRAWLRSFGVRFVVLTDSPSDYSAKAEARLLRSGRSGLPVVLRTQHLTIFEVPHARGIVTGPAPAHVQLLAASRLVFDVAGPGRYRVAIRWSPYWDVRRGCVSRAPDGTTLVTTPRAGTFELAMRVTLARSLDALAGTTPAQRCARTG